MTSTTLDRVQNVLTFTTAADIDQAAWESAMDEVTRTVGFADPESFEDLGDTHRWTFKVPAAA
jgi:hypothetical protein